MGRPAARFSGRKISGTVMVIAVPGDGEAFFHGVELAAGRRRSEAKTGIDDPGGRNAHRCVVVGALLDFGESVSAGEDLDAEQGWGADDAVVEVWERRERDVGDAVAGGGDLDAEPREGFDPPVVFVCLEEREKESLQTCMRHFTHVALRTSPSM